MKFKYWFGLGFGIDRRHNRNHAEEVYLVIPFLKIRMQSRKISLLADIH